ncbi:hypothetical protein U1Q18_000070 [Sarracenia purpurea var. burkii]
MNRADVAHHPRLLTPSSQAPPPDADKWRQQICSESSEGVHNEGGGSREVVDHMGNSSIKLVFCIPSTCTGGEDCWCCFIRRKNPDCYLNEQLCRAQCGKQPSPLDVPPPH